MDQKEAPLSSSNSHLETKHEFDQITKLSLDKKHDMTKNTNDKQLENLRL